MALKRLYPEGPHFSWDICHLVPKQKIEWFSVVWCNVFFNLRIDDIEDEIYREKLKIKKVSDELSDTFDDMLDNY